MHRPIDNQTENLEDLRGALAVQIAWFLVAAGLFVVWINLPEVVYPYQAALFAVLLIGLGILVLKGYNRHPWIMRLVLLLGSNAVLLLAMTAFGDIWIPFLGLLLTYTGAMLLPMGGVTSAVLAAIVSVALTAAGMRSYPLLPLIVVLTSGSIVSWITVNKAFTALDWTRAMHGQVNRLLDETRDRRAELVRTVRLLEQANAALVRTQSELDHARRQAEEARRLKQQFVANISHELRAPLNLILGFSEIMYQSPGVYGNVAWPPRLRQDVSKIYRSSRHLLGMIDDILDLTYAGAVGYMLNLEHTPMSPFLEEAAEIAADMFRGKDVRLAVDIAPDLPGMTIDRTRIRQVILNLLNNAQRYTDQGTVTLAAGLDAEGRLRVSVADTGRGIPEDKQSSIFEEFQQVDPSFRRQHGGAGLGLTISKKFIEAHGGHISVRSVPGQGSTFSFTLPISSLHPVDVEPGKSAGQAFAYLHPAVLVLTHNPAVLPLLSRHINAFEFIPLADPGTLGAMAEQFRPRALLVDADEMIPAGGWADRARAMPVITFSLPKQVWVGQEPVTQGYMIKPVSPQQLAEVFDRVGDVRHVLVVDDDINFIHLIERIVQIIGRDIELRRAASAEDAVASARKSRPDLVLLDLMLPTLEDGYQALRELNADPALRELPVVLLTSSSYSENMRDHVTGPITIGRRDGFHPDETLRYIEALLSRLDTSFDASGVAGPEGAHLGIDRLAPGP